MVAGNRAKDLTPKRDTIDGAVGAVSVCRASILAVAPVAPVHIQKSASEASVTPHGTPKDLGNMMTAAIEAALKPLR